MRVHFSLTYLSVMFVLGICSGISGCGKKQEGTLAANVGAVVSDAECQQFADSLEQSVKTGNTDALTASLDMEALTDTALAGLNIGAKDMQDFTNGLRSSMSKPTGFSRQIVDNVTPDGSFRLLRLLTVNNQKRARFRLASSDQGVNYMDFLLSRRANGQVKAVDIHVFMSGELLSATLRRLVLPLAAEKNKGLLARLRGEESDYLQSIGDFQKMAQATQQGNHQEAIRLYQGLPASLQKEKMALLLRMRAASALNDAEYTRALEDFRAHHANDPAADIVSIDYYYLRKQPDKALEKIDRLDKAVGGDPYLNTLRAAMMLETNRIAEALRLMEETVKAMPDEKTSLFLLAALYLAERRFDPLPALLDKIQAQGGSLTDFQQSPDYQAFVRSSAYRQWKNRPMN